ncbi:MAG: methenyltetrahydrofolate synthetase [Ruminococcaceae bacterium]|nr:methenyltetrahydrofolate synthetase [Oscillospiraceae bacterium]
MSRYTAEEAREIIRDRIMEVARPDSRFCFDFAEFITDYIGSGECAKLLADTEIYKKAEVIFITPDNNLEKFRERAFIDKKTVVITNYGITRGFFLIRPGDIPEGKEEAASLLDGVGRYWSHKTLKELKEEVKRIDMMVTGASAMTPGGLRFGKGHGFFDLEWAMTRSFGLVDESTPVFGVGHSCQVMDADVAREEYDTVMDYIVTEKEIITTDRKVKKPDCGIVWERLAPGMLESIPPLREVKEATKGDAI